ncbi:MAG: tetratricopeptide repeat protein [Cytophagaceae bacterium]
MFYTLHSKYRNRFLSLLCCGLTLLLFARCSQESNSVIARGYHNLTARDNAFFLARERMKEVEAKVYEQRSDDYNSILHPLAVYDTVKTKGLNSNTDDIIKKASMPIRKHKNSKYVDDSYMLVGRCRMYRGEFKLGLETFKFVNTTSDEDDTRHEALIHLMRAYMASDQWENAEVVMKELDKDTLHPTKTLPFYNITKAEYLWKYERYDEMLPLLVEAAPHLKPRDLKSRIYFITGQLYQQSNQKEEAYKAYKKTTKLFPPYELLFYSKLYMAQCSDASSSKDYDKQIKYFNKLLTDLKNTEYKDKIYYEMGLFEYNLGHQKEAINYYKKSTQVSKGGAQKSLSFLKLAEIHYDELEDYVNAQAYYDSCNTLFNKKDKRYPLIEKRTKVLDEFVKHYNVYKREDSLLRVSEMDSASYRRLIDTLVAREQAEYMRKQIEARKLAKKQDEIVFNPDKFANLDPNNANPSWYFSNPTAIKNGISEFERRWGKRKLEDHWRRAKKEIIIDNNTKDSTGKPIVNTSSKDDIPPLVVDRSKYDKDVPFLPAQKDSSLKRMEIALYHIGSIYNHKLDEPTRALKTYDIFLKRFPESDYEAEVLYNMYLICKENNKPEIEIYKNRILNEHPNSIYAKLIRNPNYFRDNKIANAAAEKEYEQVYGLYKSGSYSTSDSLASILLVKYPESSIEDKLEYLKLLCELKSKGPNEALIAKIDDFMDKYKDSDLIANAKGLKTSIQKSLPKPPNNKSSDTDTP